jgi:hypothetical protein
VCHAPRWVGRDQRCRLRAPGFRAGDKIVEEREGLLNLMIHVHKDRGIEGIRRQPRIVRITEA